MTFSTPILFLIFNRPSTTAKVLECIRSIKPNQLYIACDGPRVGNIQDQKLVHQTRSIVDQIDWECSIHKLYRDANLGCRKAISGALKWFFSHVERGIILEDDVLPSEDFFHAMNMFLEIYKDDFKISSICGRNELALSRGATNIPTLTDKFWCWGWASWSNRFNDFNSELPYKPHYKSNFIVNSIFDRAHTNSMITAMRLGNVNTWDYPLDFFFRSRSMKSLLLPFNSIINLGFGSGTHTSISCADNAFHQFPLNNSYFQNIPVYDKSHTLKIFLLRNSGSYIKLILYIIAHYFLAISLKYSRYKSFLKEAL